MKHGILATSKNEVESIESWLGAQVDLVATTMSQNLPIDISAVTWNNTSTLESVFGQTDRSLLVSYEMARTEGHDDGDYSGAANGKYDDAHRRFAQQLVNRGMTETVVRPNHEFNLSWSGKYPKDPKNYASAFARVVREMNSVDGANFTYLYSPSRNRLGIAPEAWPPDASEWPDGQDPPLVVTSNYDKGGQYPDDISNVTHEDRVNNWEQVTLQNIHMWEDFAEQRGSKYGGSPEWGLMGEGTPQAGGGDNPWFIEKYLTYAENNGFELQTYWNANHHTIYPRGAAGLEEASDKFKQMVSSRLQESSSGDSNTDTDSGITSYGGYNQPALGTLDWHVPLNENFAKIESDLQDLAERVQNLEQ